MRHESGVFHDGLTRKAAAAVLIALLLFSAYLRRYAFWMAHWTGDQSQYTALALKLDKIGMDGYNLRGVRLGISTISEDPPVNIVYVKIGDPSAEGDILRILRLVGQAYWDEPLHMRAPLYPYLLMWSHRFFERDSSYYSAVSSHLGSAVASHRPPQVFKAQFWSAVLSFTLNLLIVALTFVLAARLFGARTGAVAAFVMATNPVSLMTAHRALAEDPLVFFSTLSLLAWWKWGERLPGAALSGALLGLAVLTKQSALYQVPAVWAYAFLTSRADRRTWRGLLRSAFDPRFILFMFGLTAVTAWWFIRVWQTYGDPFHVPAQAMIESLKTDQTGWFETLRRRPHPVIFFLLGTVLSSPLMGFALLSLGRLRAGLSAVWRGVSDRDPYVFLWLWTLAAYAQLTRPWRLLEPPSSQEHRYFYIAYPALAALAAAALLEMSRGWRMAPAVRDAVVCAILLAAALVSVPQGLRVVFENKMLF